jgi:hypothetical protein
VSRFSNTGGLWMRESTGKGAPRYRGNFECSCGKRHQLLGWGKDQMGPKAKDGSPLIIIKGGAE